MKNPFSFRLRLPGLVGLAAFCAVAGGRAENLISNSSFEIPGVDYACVKFLDPAKNPSLTYEGAEIDPAAPKYGKASLRVPNPYGEGFRLALREVPLQPGTEYTVSAWMRSDTEGLALSIQAISVLSPADNPTSAPAWDVQGKAFVLSKEWKRYSYTVRTPAQPRFYSLVLTGKDKGSCWIDAVQVNAGPLQDYAPRAGLEIALRPSQLLYLLDGAPQSAAVDCVAANDTGEALSRSVTVTARDEADGAAAFTGTVTLTVPPHGTATVPVEMPLARFGGFDLEISGAEGADALTPAYFAVAGKIVRDRDKPVDLDTTFSVGLCADGAGFYSNKSVGNVYAAQNQSLDAHFQLLADMGCRVLRSFEGDPFSWSLIEPQQGVFDFKYTDPEVNYALRHGIRILANIGDFTELSTPNNNVFPHLPEWLRPLSRLDNSAAAHFFQAAQSLYLPPLDLWEKHLAALASHYKGLIDHYEIMNEPNFYIAPKEYDAYLKSAHSILQQNGAKTLGFCVSSDFGQNGSDWSVEAARLGGLSDVDAVSFHPYSARQLGSPRPADQEIATLRALLAKAGRGDVPLWNTELFFMNLSGTPTDATAPMVAYRFLTDLGEGVRQSTCIQASKVFKKLLRPHMNTDDAYVELAPSPVYVAYNALARFFEGAVPVAKIRWPNDAICYVYRRDGATLAAFWKYGSDAQLNLALDLDDAQAALFDIFGNPVPLTGKPIVLRENPYYLKYKGSAPDDFIAKLKAAAVAAESPVLLDGLRLVPLDGGIGAALFVENRGDDPLDGLAAVTGEGVGATRTPFRLAARETAAVVVPVTFSGEAPATVTARIAAAGKVRSFADQPILPLKSYACGGGPGERAALASNRPGGNFQADFQASHDAANLILTVTVRDGRFAASPFQAGKQPWEQACIELFLDADPLGVPAPRNVRAYTDATARIFLLPGAPPEQRLIVWPAKLGGLTADRIAATVASQGDGYVARLTVPLDALKAAAPLAGKSLGFDILVDPAGGNPSPAPPLRWSALNGKAHQDRFSFGFLRFE